MRPGMSNCVSVVMQRIIRAGSVVSPPYLSFRGSVAPLCDMLFERDGAIHRDLTSDRCSTHWSQQSRNVTARHSWLTAVLEQQRDKSVT